MEIPDDLRYTREHEWARIDLKQKTATIGLTDYAQEHLGDVVHVDLPEEGAELAREEPFGSVESVKAVSDVFAPISGKVIEINDDLLDSPEMMNEDPYGEAWLVKVKFTDTKGIDKLMDAAAYKKYCESQEE
ncbi:MAG: glycine cleavage system protein GcvH [Pseudomonadota bacterium]